MIQTGTYVALAFLGLMLALSGAPVTGTAFMLAGMALLAAEAAGLDGF